METRKYSCLAWPYGGIQSPEAKQSKKIWSIFAYYFQIKRMCGYTALDVSGQLDRFCSGLRYRRGSGLVDYRYFSFFDHGHCYELNFADFNTLVDNGRCYKPRAIRYKMVVSHIYSPSDALAAKGFIEEKYPTCLCEIFDLTYSFYSPESTHMCIIADKALADFIKTRKFLFQKAVDGLSAAICSAT